MFTRMLILITLILAGTVFLTGAWSGSLAPPPQTSGTRFAPQTVPLDADIVGSGVNAADLLTKAMQKLAPAQTAWLKTKVRQTMNEGQTPITAEGFLQRGPHHCARLEMEVTRGTARTRLVIVSDGEVLARVRTLRGAAPKAALEHLPAPSDEAPHVAAAAKEQCLAAKSCGGPFTLLQHLSQHLQNGKLQTGLLDGQPAIQIKGNLSPSAHSKWKTPARVAYVYLDAKTLWPHRLEWWGQDKTQALRPIVQIEFLDPEINRELTMEECTRVFSYQPVGNEKVTEK